MFNKVFNWLQDTTIQKDRVSMSSIKHYGIGSTGNEISGLSNSSKPQYETMKAVLYMGIR
jgi:hypothetical protein